jgi:hypothetical protein
VATLAKDSSVSRSSSNIPSEAIETNDFADFEAKVRELAALYGHDQILVAYDIDNTLLATNQFLGGDQWYNWQSAEMQKPQPNEAITQDAEAFALICTKLLTLSAMHPPEPEIPTIVRRIQDAGVTSIALTARRYDLRDATSVSLRENGFDFTRRPLGNASGYADTFMPYDLEKPEDYGLTKGLVQTLALGAPRPVSYSRGIIMSGGIHKGVVLRSMLHKTGRSVKAILFIDDAPHNTKNVQAAFTDTKITVMTYRYGREDQKVKQFQASDKAEVKREWKEFQSMVDKLFPRHP